MTKKLEANEGLSTEVGFFVQLLDIGFTTAKVTFSAAAGALIGSLLLGMINPYRCDASFTYFGTGGAILGGSIAGFGMYASIVGSVDLADQVEATADFI